MRYKMDKRFEEDARAVRAGITKAFRILRKRGYVALQNFMCCQSCARSEIANRFDKKGTPEEDRKLVFYHQQDAVALRETGTVFLAWSGNGWEIAYALRDAGLQVEWDGDPEKRILVRKETT